MVSIQKNLVSGECLTSDVTCDPWNWTDTHGVWDGDQQALVCRNPIDLCGPKSAHGHGDEISNFVTSGTYTVRIFI